MKKIKNNFSVLVPDGEFYFLMVILDCLSHIKGIKIYVMSDVKYTAMRYSRYIHNYSYYPKTTNDLEWVNNVNREVELHNIDIILPIYEGRIRTLVYHSEHLTHKEKLVPLPAPKFYEIACNKWLLAKHMKDFGVNLPKSFIMEPEELNIVENQHIEFPVIAKPPKDVSGGVGIFKFDTKEEFLNHFRENEMKEAHLIQEYVEGHDMGCNVICKEGEILAFSMQKGNMWSKKPFSPQIGLNMVYEDDLYKTVKKLMKSLNWSGVANVDLRYDKKNDNYKVLEINPRYWSTLHASLIADINFPYLLCLTALGENYEVPDYERIEYLNLKGLIRKIGRRKSFLFNFKYIRKNTPLKYAIKDPVPSIYKFIWRTKNVIMLRLKGKSTSTN